MQGSALSGNVAEQNHNSVQAIVPEQEFMHNECIDFMQKICYGMEAGSSGFAGESQKGRKASISFSRHLGRDAV
jgi:hypothetical protein